MQTCTRTNIHNYIRTSPILITFPPSPSFAQNTAVPILHSYREILKKVHTITFTSPVHCLTLWHSSFRKAYNLFPMAHRFSMATGVKLKPGPKLVQLADLLFRSQGSHNTSMWHGSENTRQGCLEKNPTYLLL